MKKILALLCLVLAAGCSTGEPNNRPVREGVTNACPDNSVGPVCNNVTGPTMVNEINNAFATMGSGSVTSVSGTSNQVAVASGTTTPVISLVGPYTPATYTAHGILVGEGTSGIAALVVCTNGQVPVGVTGSDPLCVTISRDGTLTNAGVLTILGSNGNLFTGTTFGASLGLSTNTTISATNIATGTLPNAQLPASISVTNLTASGLTSGNCVQASTGGLLTTTSSACGSGGGSFPSGAPPQVAGFSASNTSEAETVSGDYVYTRAGANSYVASAACQGSLTLTNGTSGTVSNACLVANEPITITCPGDPNQVAPTVIASGSFVADSNSGQDNSTCPWNQFR